MYKIYGLFGLIRLMYSYALTKIFFRSAKLIKFPIDIRGRKHMKWGSNFTTGFNCRLESYPSHSGINVCLSIGNNVQLNDDVHITAISNVTIGDNVLMASKIYISDNSHGSYLGNADDSHPDTMPKDRPLSSRNVLIEDNVWIGEFVSVLPGVTIGKGSIIGSNSVVTKSIPPYCIAVGIPALVVKKFNFETNRWEKSKNE